jgi:hypothetical protein
VPEAITIVAPLLVAAVLAAGAIGKLRDPSRAAEGFKALDVPPPWSSPGVVRAHPFVEIVVAVLLVVATGWLAVVAGLAALGLMLVYLWLVVRAVRSPVDVDCACFGAWGADRVTTQTVWRNGWLTLLAGLALWAVVAADASVLGLVGAVGAWWWVVALVATALTTVLVVAGPRESSVNDTADPGDLAVEEDDYLRTRTPAVPITLGDGTVTHLRKLSAGRPQLLVYVSEGCGSCQQVIRTVPSWRDRLPELDVRVMVRQTTDVSGLTSAEEPMSVHDTEGLAWESLGIRGVPSAVLLGADGLLAGGPVLGGVDVPAFVDDIHAELQAAQQS